MSEGFRHSVRVPRLYKVAATVAKKFSEGLGSLKQLIFEQTKHPNVKGIHALVFTLFNKRDELEKLLKRTQFLAKESRCDEWLTKILFVELLWGKRRLNGQSKPEITVRAYEQILRAHLSDLEQEPRVQEDSATTKPRYVRVNTLLISFEDAVQKFRNEGWDLKEVIDKTDYDGFLATVAALEASEFLVDIHIPNLLIFPPKTEFFNHPAYKQGQIMLQDKASCLPVHLLAPPPGSLVLDMCAAPGMKTTHLAAIMNDKGTVFAVERNPRRFEILNNVIESSGATCIKSCNRDVLTCDASDFPGVEYILVDPSCSGSGMTDRNPTEDVSAERLRNLAGFQIKILRKAVTKFPQAKRVVYSTCSKFSEENEDVVRQVLETNYNFKLVNAEEFVQHRWKNFGSSDFGDIGKYCLYTKPNDDLTNGFFVAVFERLEDGEENKFFSDRVYHFKRIVQSEVRREKKKLKREFKKNQKQVNVEGAITGNDDEKHHNTKIKPEETLEQNFVLEANDLVESEQFQVKAEKKERRETEGKLEIGDDGTEIIDKEKDEKVKTDKSGEPHPSVSENSKNIVDGKHLKTKRKKKDPEEIHNDDNGSNIHSKKEKKSRKENSDCTTNVHLKEEIEKEAKGDHLDELKHKKKKTVEKSNISGIEVIECSETEANLEIAAGMKKRKKHEEKTEMDVEENEISHKAERRSKKEKWKADGTLNDAENKEVQNRQERKHKKLKDKDKSRESE